MQVFRSFDLSSPQINLFAFASTLFASSRSDSAQESLSATLFPASNAASYRMLIFRATFVTENPVVPDSNGPGPCPLLSLLSADKQKTLGA